MIERKTVLKELRKNVKIKQYITFSDKGKTYQKVKFYGCYTDIDLIKNHFNKKGLNNIIVEGSGSRCTSVVLKFPYTHYT